MPPDHRQREWFIRFVLALVCLVFWRSELNFVTFPLLILAWLMDGGISRFYRTLREPMVQAILLLCILLLLGLLWGDPVENGRMKWLKYFVLLFFIPFHGLLNKDRLPWAVGGLIAGYLGVLTAGIYQGMDAQGITLLQMSYLGFSALLGTGVIVMIGLSCLSPSVGLRLILWTGALLLLYMQFQQGGRVFLVATLIAVLLMAVLYFKKEKKRIIGIAILMLGFSSILAYNSIVFQDRWARVFTDIELLQQNNYSSSLGYRLAIWDVGLHGIAERPWTGHGTGNAGSYFDRTILTYKDGIYKDLPQFQKTSHYHNDWIEIGMHIGIPGMLALSFLLLSWYRTFSKNQLEILGAGLISYIFLAGLTDAFMIFGRIPVFLLMITAIILCWNKQRSAIH